MSERTRLHSSGSLPICFSASSKSECVKPQSEARSLSNDTFDSTLNELPTPDKESGEMPVMKTLRMNPSRPIDFTVDQKDLKVDPTAVPSQAILGSPAVCCSSR